MAIKVNFKDCVAAIKEVAGDDMSESEAKSFVEAVVSRIENADAEKLKNLESKIQQVGAELTGEMSKVEALNKRNALMSVQAVRNLYKYAKTYASPFEGILAYLEDSKRSIQGAGRGINSIIEGYKTRYLGELKSRLTRDGVLKEFMGDNLEKEVFKEFYAPGSSGSKKAKAIRDILFSMKQDMVKTQNLYGSFINFLPEHVKRQTYNTYLIKRNFGPERFKDFFNFNRNLTPEEHAATFQKWKEFMMPLLDHEETFKDSDKDEFLKSAFDGIMSGKHGTVEPATGAEINTKFFKTGSMANKASTQRLFHFKDGESAYAAHKAFSAETLSRGVLNEFQHAATNIGLMQQLGPNPLGTLSEVIGRMEQEYSRSGEEAKLRDLQHNKNKLYSALGFLDKSALVPANPNLATATSSAIQLLSMAKLGKMLFFALPDRALMHSMMTRNGMKGMDALGAALSLRKPSNPEERLRLQMLGGEARSFTNHVASRYSTGSETGVPTWIMSTQRKFFDFTGIHWFDDVGASAIVGALPRHLGAMSDRSFDNLIPEVKRMFQSFDISSKEWNAMRHTAYTEGPDRWITPDKFKELPDGVINDLLDSRGIPRSDNNRARQRDLLASKYETWLTAQRDEAVPMPGSKEHRLATFGTQPGTPLGSMVRLLMMFKTFPISMYTKVLRKEMYGTGARTFMEWMQNEKASNFHTTQLIAMSTIAGYIAMSAEDLLAGKNLRSFHKQDGSFDADSALATTRDAFLRGGAGSLQADLLLREYDNGQNNIVRAMGGPAVGLGIDTADTFSHLVRGDEKAKAGLKYVRDNTPWVNLFYLKPAIDHLVWYNIQEMLDPGSLREQELRHKEKYNQDYWMPPSEVHKELFK